jgi:hypothetical protein
VIGAKPSGATKKVLKRLAQADEAFVQKQVASIVQNALWRLVRRLKAAGARSSLDYDRLELIWTRDWYAVVLPEEKRVLSDQDRGMWVMLLEGPSGLVRDLSVLGPIPLEAIPAPLLASGKGVLRRVTPDEYEGAVKALKKQAHLLVQAGWITEADELDPKRLDRAIRFMPAQRYALVDAPTDLAFEALREEYGVGGKAVDVWSSALKEMKAYIVQEMKAQRKAILTGSKIRSVKPPRGDIENPETMEGFTEGIERKAFRKR